VLAVAWGYRQVSRLPRVHRWLERAEAQTGRYKGLIQRWGWLGLAAFVLLPLPGTGVWGGVVLSRLLGVATLPLWFGLSIGVALSGLVFGAGTQGAMALIQLFR
ncbi:MAG TPA: small multi-drug export protein, partial [Symbiobacteriaceae bacterium]|nr:small multi-drug export protein [Symbiobacteriaceae bacterium]